MHARAVLVTVVFGARTSLDAFSSSFVSPVLCLTRWPSSECKFREHPSCTRNSKARPIVHSSRSLDVVLETLPAQEIIRPALLSPADLGAGLVRTHLQKKKIRPALL